MWTDYLKVDLLRSCWPRALYLLRWHWAGFWVRLTAFDPWRQLEMRRKWRGPGLPEPHHLAVRRPFDPFDPEEK